MLSAYRKVNDANDVATLNIGGSSAIRVSFVVGYPN
jgi:hypothetical protein